MNERALPYLAALETASLVKSVGYVTRKSGLLIESRGPIGAGIGDLCHIEVPGRPQPILAEVAGLDEARLRLLPYGAVDGLQPGCRVLATGKALSVPVSEQLLGRVVDAFCRPLDEGGALSSIRNRPVRNVPIQPLLR
jgi:flagellum-specific ATP synthase